jgi:hypothetical protein
MGLNGDVDASPQLHRRYDHEGNVRQFFVTGRAAPDVSAPGSHAFAVHALAFVVVAFS